MLILFTLILARMSGAVQFNPVLGRTNLPGSAKAALAFTFSVLLYAGSDGQAPVLSGLLEFGLLILSEFLLGFAIGFMMELAFAAVRFASSVMDFVMGLSMAQIYDPQYNMQTTLTSGLFYAFLAMLFFATDGHIRLISIFFMSSRIVPFGQVAIQPELAQLMIESFSWSILTGLQLAFPLVAMELVTEAAVGILMKIIPQINVFAVNFQIKIIVGLLMLIFLFSPMADELYAILEQMGRYLIETVWIFRAAGV